MTYTVSWRYNDREYFENYPTLLQAMVRFWRLNDDKASIHVKD